MFSIDKDKHEQHRKTAMSSRPPENPPQNSRRHTSSQISWSIVPSVHVSQEGGVVQTFYPGSQRSWGREISNFKRSLIYRVPELPGLHRQSVSKNSSNNNKKVFKSSEVLSLENFIFKNLEYWHQQKTEEHIKDLNTESLLACSHSIIWRKDDFEVGNTKFYRHFEI